MISMPVIVDPNFSPMRSANNAIACSLLLIHSVEVSHVALAVPSTER